MEFRIQLDPGMAASEQRTIYQSIPLEYREVYLERLSPALAELVSAQTVRVEPALEAA